MRWTTIFPFDRAGRLLVYHPESDSLFLASEEEFHEILDTLDGSLCVDVTGDKKFESIFKKKQSTNIMKKETLSNAIAEAERFLKFAKPFEKSWVEHDKKRDQDEAEAKKRSQGHIYCPGFSDVKGS